MQIRDLSKLQIRAEVLGIIQQYKIDTDFKISKQKEDLERLKSIKDKASTIDILLKELLKAENLKKTAISFFITEIAELSDIEDTLWAYIKNPKISDAIKEEIVSILKTLGGRIKTEELLDNLESPEDIIDKETKSLLEIATINPEAQIDFLDFLFSLKDNEQLQLIESLKEDYISNELANILAPALLSTSNPDVQKALIETLGDTKSYFAIPPILAVSQNAQDENIKRLAIKNLNKLKLSGINIQDTEKANLRELQICQMTQFYQAYASQIDGSGAQGLILSRIADEKIFMFTVIINDSMGVLDCFGFSGISKDEFDRIVERFQNTPSTTSQVPAEYCKNLLSNAEKLNFKNGTPLPYEYLCWKAYAYDINIMDFDINYSPISMSQADFEELYSTSDFDTWFFEYSESDTVDELICYSIESYSDNNQNYIQNLEEKIIDSIRTYFKENSTDIICSRLKMAGMFYEVMQQEKYKNICLSLANSLQNDDINELAQSKFIIDIFKRSIVQYIILIMEENAKKLIQSKTKFTSAKPMADKPNMDNKFALGLIDVLERNWK